MTKSLPLIWDLLHNVKTQIDGEDFVNFCGLLRKHELYLNIFGKQMNYQTSITDYLTGRWILRIYGCCILKLTEVWMNISLKRHWLANSKIIYKWHLHTSKIFASWLLTRYSKNLSFIWLAGFFSGKETKPSKFMISKCFRHFQFEIII